MANPVDYDTKDGCTRLGAEMGQCTQYLSIMKHITQRNSILNRTGSNLQDFNLLILNVHKNAIKTSQIEMFVCATTAVFNCFA